MKILVGFSLLICVVICYPNTKVKSEPDKYPLPYILNEKLPGVFVKEDLTKPVDKVKVADSDVKIYIFTQKNNNSGLEIEVANASVAKTPFDPKKPTCFVIHGWNNDRTSTLNHLVKDAILESKDVNVFIVDWSKYADKNYLSAHNAVPGVAKIVAKFVQLLEKSKHLTTDRTFLVGHSLGAHVSGLVGAALNSQLDYIIGLDPAWPLFSSSDTESRLDYTDAKYVQVIHTCAGRLGFPISIGHSDYYPNGGAVQEGCGVQDVTGSCSHGRSYEYLAESIRGYKYAATRCSNYEAYKRGECKNQRASWMGGYNIDKK
ncbi:unnamed protein product [Acanthoscelides obtectus]|uniref:Lipase domain-containing protein n=1 Tax=Acanthoscelides obtectus TaxID=200917 RepID=A0A9P0L754_ACAOB|nr:unnamed protein product [Acanthoscelides obtectus]CAK1662217.1 Lipase member H-A [Acanthoscelides obtectus]